MSYSVSRDPFDQASTSASASPVPQPQAGPSKPRSQMTPAELQAANLSKLMAKPEKEVRIPALRSEEKQLRAPKELMKNVSGSSAGAGSGEFHVYKHARRREYERIKLMENADKRTKEQIAFEEAQAAREAELESKTAKNKSKRDKRKAAKQRSKPEGAASKQNGTHGTDAGAGSKRTAAAAQDTDGESKRRKLAPGAEGLTFSKPDDEGSEEE